MKDTSADSGATAQQSRNEPPHMCVGYCVECELFLHMLSSTFSCTLSWQTLHCWIISVDLWLIVSCFPFSSVRQDVEKERELRTEFSREEIRQRIELYNSVTKDHLKMTLVSKTHTHTSWVSGLCVFKLELVTLLKTAEILYKSVFYHVDILCVAAAASSVKPLYDV